MRYFCLLLLLSPLISCKSQRLEHHDLSDANHTIVVTESMYDSIAPPKLIIDSVKFYVKLAELLKATNKFETNNTTILHLAYYVIKENGELKLKWMDSGPPFINDMAKITNEMESDISKWEPAYLKSTPQKKIAYEITVGFHIHDNNIEFDIHGNQSFYFLEKTFKRPL